MTQVPANRQSMKHHDMHTWTIFIDGASRNNPGMAGAGVVMKKDGQNVALEGFYLGLKTNNQAEYLALLLALFFIHQYAKLNDTIRLISDSELLVKQMRGTYRVKNEGLLPLYSLAQTMTQNYNIEFMHVVREDNKEADALANKGINSKKPLPAAFISMLERHHIAD